MPSAALMKFETRMIVDVERLIDSHAALNAPGLGRRSLGHVTRSGVLMLCAAWERYIEDLAIEVAGLICARATDPAQMPLNARKTLSNYVKEHQHELKPLGLAGFGWRDVYLEYVNLRMEKLNTPKSGAVDEEYNKLLGWKEPSKKWSRGRDFINDFVSVRGDIAHQGSEANYVRIDTLRDTYLSGIKETVVEHDNAACDFLVGVMPGPRPWRRR